MSDSTVIIYQTILDDSGRVILKKDARKKLGLELGDMVDIRVIERGATENPDNAVIEIKKVSK